jgi:hypothetical protein
MTIYIHTHLLYYIMYYTNLVVNVINKNPDPHVFYKTYKSNFGYGYTERTLLKYPLEVCQPLLLLER